MHSTPDSARRFCRALYRLFHGPYFGARRVQKQLYFLGNAGHLKPIQSYDLLAVIDWPLIRTKLSKITVKPTVESTDDRLSVCALFHDNLDVWVCAGKSLDMVVDECASVGGRGPFVAELEDKLPDVRSKRGVPVRRRRAQLRPQQRAKRRQAHRGG